MINVGQEFRQLVEPVKLKRVQRQISPVPATAASVRWSHWSILLGGFSWACVVASVHFSYAAQKIPLTLSRSLSILSVETVMGPLFLNFWCAHAMRTIFCLLFMLGVQKAGRYIGEHVGAFVARSEPDALEFSISLGLGLVFVGYLAFALFLIPVVSAPLIRLFFFALCVVGAREAYLKRRIGGEPPLIKLDVAERILFAILGMGSVLAFVGTTAPEISYDALVYHLAVPKNYLLAGHLANMPYNHYSYLPLLTSMIYIWGLAINGMYMAKLLNFFIGMALLHAIYSHACRLSGRTGALAASALFISTPMILYLFWVSNSDMGAALFLLLALICCWRWREQERAVDLYLVGLFCGAALATKYTTALGVSMLAGYCGLKLFSGKADRRAYVLTAFVALVLIPLLPWWIRNYIYQGNPFFPYATQYFGGRNFDPELLRNWYAETRDATPGFAIVQHSMKIWRDSTIGFDSLPYTYLGPLVLGLAPLSIFLLGFTWQGAVLGVSLVICLLGFSATYITRLLVPYLAVAMTGAAYCLAERNRFRPLLLGLFIVASMHNLYRWGQIVFLTSVKGGSVAMGQQSAGQYLSKARNLYPNPSYGAFRYIEGLNLPKDAKVLLVGDSRTFYSPRQTIASAPHDIPILFALADSARDVDELFGRLSSENVSVVVSNKVGGAIHSESEKYSDPRPLLKFSAMLDEHFDKEFEDEWTVVHRVKNLQH